MSDNFKNSQMLTERLPAPGIFLTTRKEISSFNPKNNQWSCYLSTLQKGELRPCEHDLPQAIRLGRPASGLGPGTLLCSAVQAGSFTLDWSPVHRVVFGRRFY